MSFPKYGAYKDSGVEWLGEMPEHWGVAPLKYNSTCNDQALSDSTPEDYELEYVEISDVDEVQGITGTNSYIFADAPSRARRIVQDGDVLISTVRTYLRAIAPVVDPPNNLIASTGFAVIRPQEDGLIGNYLGYLLRAEWWIAEIISQSVGVSYPAINASDLVGIKVPVPATSEQTQIARFLDHETARIDALIAEQERLIELLKEKRQAVISHAVTKGCDRTVPMKDSGVEWLGEVPAHWAVINFQLVVSIAEGQVDPSIKPYSEMVLIAPNHIESRTGRILSVETAEEQGADSGKYLCQAGDVVYSKIRPALRKVCIATEDSLCSADMYPMRGHSGMSNDYLFWFILSEPFSAFALLESDRVAMPKINRDSLGRLKVVRPPLSEQAEIAVYLNTETVRIDALVEQAKEGVKFLQERRSALISTAVTGKIDVRGWQPPASAAPAATLEAARG